MKFKPVAITSLLLLSFVSMIAQVNDRDRTGESVIDAKDILKITLKSDSSTKSVLVSNVKEDKAGDMSPVIGAAAWKDGEKELLCRSLLEFDFNLIPVEILNDPLLILEASLVLYPIQAEFAAKDNEKSSIIYIRQVEDQWEDSSTRWNNQPHARIENQASATIDAKNKNIPASIDVTDIVVNIIFKEMNNGFMLAHDENHNTSHTAGQLFASPKNVNPSLRPELVLYVKIPKDNAVTYKISPVKPVNVKDLDYYNKWKIQRENWIRQNESLYRPVNPAAHQSIFPRPSNANE